MNHIHIDERGNDFWSQLGAGVGLAGRMLFDNRNDRGYSKELQNQLIQRKQDELAGQNKLLGAYAANEALGDKVDLTQRGLLSAQLANAGIAGVTQNNYQDFQKGLLAQQGYLDTWDPMKTFAERKAMGGTNGFLRNMPGLF